MEKKRPISEKEDYIKRLNKISGQINGISKMIIDDRYCADILTQISAATNGLKALGNNILLNHMKSCMVNDIKNGKYDSIDEAVALCKRLL